MRNLSFQDAAILVAGVMFVLGLIGFGDCVSTLVSFLGGSRSSFRK